jgi:mono/diheme cytochrome c family protein
MRTSLCVIWLGLVFASGSVASQDAATPPAEAPPKTTRHKPSIASNLVFDATTKSYEAKVSDTNAVFEFNLTNIWTNEITIDRAETSCGCTLASLPSNPWHIAPGEHGVVGVTVNLEGKAAGQITKFVTLYLSANGNFLGTRVATVKIAIPEHPAANAMAKLSEADRRAAMLQAKADPRKIFTDAGCAKCHADRGRKAATGPELYAVDCAICHDSPNRASFVPDLHTLKVPVSLEYWTAIVTYGKTNTLMPGFASFKGGPLNENQVHILSEYLASAQFTAVHPATNAAAKAPVPSEP